VLCSDYHYPSMLQSVYILARNGSAGFEDAVGLVTKNAARMAWLEDRGTLGLGQRGDILLVEPGDVPRLVAVIAGGRLAYLSPDGMGRVGIR
jgi:alpha-D-ribose 1-methylphosphonate 5-triphosphate diphosphatase